MLAIAIHKIPEGPRAGRHRPGRHGTAPRGSGLVFAGRIGDISGEAALELGLASYLGPHALNAALAVAGGSFLYLGGHAVHGEFRRRGVAPGFLPALAGIASPSVFRLFRLL